MKNKKTIKLGYQILLIIILAVIFGFGAGVAGELWLNDFLTGEQQSDRKIQTLSERLDELTERQDKKLKEILADKDLSISQTLENVRPSIVNVYQSERRTDSIQDVLLSKDLLGVGVILTADGWILTDRKVVGEKTGEQLVITFEKDIYSVEKKVCDQSTNACFAKINAENLPVVNLTAREFLTSGQTGLVVSLNEIIPTSIKCLYCFQPKTAADLIRSSEKFYKNIELTKDLDNKYVGSPVVNLQGQVFGIVSSDNQIIAIDHLQSIIKRAVGEEEISRNYLGIHYLDLSEAAGWEKFADQKKGALILGNENHPAVAPAGPAQKAGLLANDIIVSVEEEQVTETKTLTSLIQSYKVGEELKMKILRRGEEKEINVVLTAWK